MFKIVEYFCNRNIEQISTKNNLNPAKVIYFIRTKRAGEITSISQPAHLIFVHRILQAGNTDC